MSDRLDNTEFPVVQISLDLTTIDEALETATLAVEAGVDWLEVGTPLILAEGLRAFALADAGVVEGLVHAREPIVAVQWHPERPNPARDFDLRLLADFFGKGALWSEG